MSESKFDRYSRSARLIPALITAIPGALVIVGAGIRLSAIGTLIVTPLVAMGLIHLLSQLARDRGRDLQPTLFAQWGGAPTTARLRHRDTAINRVTKMRYHAKGSVVLGIPFPTEREELDNPDAADEVYQSFVDYLRDHTRDSAAFPLVLEENINFGFRRNLLGLRFLGLPLSVVGCGINFWLLFRSGTTMDKAVELIALLISLGLWYFWLFVCTTEWVRPTADAYSLRLLECSERL
jgi:hypothetical protein